MSKRFDPKIKEIMHALHAGGFVMKGIRNGIRVKLQNGIDVDFYTLKSDTEHVRARIRTEIEDEAARIKALSGIWEQLQQGLGDTAEIEEFRLTKQENGVCSYYTRVFPGAEELLIFEAQEDGGEETAASRLMVAPKETAPTALGGAAYKNELENAVTLLEAVDPKMFRKALDDLGLSRSSLLRVVLTRLFRAAVELEELEAAIPEEAERISDPQDRMALEQIRAFNTIEFLDPLIRMLHREAVADDSDFEVRMA